MFDEKFWVAVSFVILVVLIARPLLRLITTGLDNRSQKIKDELDKAVALREEAQAILADYKRKKEDALLEVEQIIEQAEHSAQHILETSRAELEESLNRRVEMAMQKIAQYKAQALQEVQGSTMDLAICAVQSLLKEELANNSVDASIDASVAEIDKKFH